MQDLVFGAAGRKCQILRRASPVMGVWGWGDCERPRSARRSPETDPQGIFGVFLGKQKETRPAGRNPPPLTT